MKITLRGATPHDVMDIATLADVAGEGLPNALWESAAGPSETALEAGARLASRETGTFSWSRTTVADVNGVVAGMMISENIGDTVAELTEDVHPILRPIATLQKQALGTRSIEMIAVAVNFRRLGVGSILLNYAEQNPGPQGVSMIMTDGHLKATAFSSKLGYDVKAEVPLIKANWVTAHRAWHLLKKSK